MGVGFVTGVEASWGDIGARMGLVVGGGSSLHLLGCPIALVFGSEVVGCDSAAFGIDSLANMVVAGLGRGGLSLGMMVASSWLCKKWVEGLQARSMGVHRAI